MHQINLDMRPVYAGRELTSRLLALGGRWRYLLALACSTGFVFLAVPVAHAQTSGGVDQPATAKALNAADVGEIVVTARRREETLQSVPVVASAIGEQQIAQFQTRDLRDIAARIPGLQIGEQSQAIGTQVSIRGVGTTSSNPGIDQSVALSVDNLQLTQGLFFRSAFFDIAQVEVYKGPQPLFYGKSTTGGVIAIRTADPTDNHELIARAGYEFEANEQQYELIASGPLTDALKIRLAGQYGRSDGYFHNLAVATPGLGGATPPNDKLPGKNYLLRGTLLWNPSDQIDVRLKVNHGYDRQLRSGVANTLCPDGTGPTPGLGIAFLSPLDNCKANDRKVYVVDLDPAAYPGFADPRLAGLLNDGVPFTKTRLTYGSLEINFRPTDDLTLTSTTGYDQVSTSSLFNTIVTAAAGPVVAITQDFRRHDFSQELRLNSDFDSSINFTAGAFFHRGKFSNAAALVTNQPVITAVSQVLFGIPNALPFPDLLVHGTNRISTNTNSVFGQLRVAPSPMIEIALGGRYADDRRVNRPYDFLATAPVATPDPRLRSKTFSPEATVSYRPNADLTLFASAKRAYKSGSFDIVVPATAGQSNSFGDEKVTGGEVGIKSRLLDRRLTANVAGYYYEFKGLQVGAIDANSGGFSSRTINGANARNYGIEAELTYRPDISGLTLHGAVNWNRSKFTKLENVPCYGGQLISEGCNTNFNPTAYQGGTDVGRFTTQTRTGLPLVRAPVWQIEAGPTYEMDTFAGTRLVLGASGQYSSKYLTTLPQPYYQPGVFKLDLSATLFGKDDRWEIGLVGKNITDQVVTGSCGGSDNQSGYVSALLPFAGFQRTGVASNRGPAGIDEQPCFIERGRSVWARLTFRM